MLNRKSGANQPILFDVTFAYRSIGAHPHGILRSERAFARSFLERPDLDVTFCRFDRRSGKFVRVPRADVDFMTWYVHESGRWQPRNLARSVRDTLELLRSRDVRRYRRLRWDLGRLVRAATGFGVIDERTIEPGTVLVLAGMIFDTHDMSAVMRLKRTAAFKIFAICYDVIPIVHPEFLRSHEVVERFRRQTLLLLESADRIASISRSARDDLAAFARSEGARVPDLTTLVLGFDIPRKEVAVRPRSLPPLRERGYVLCVGNINIRKNHVLLYRVWRRLALERGDRLVPLVIAGDVGWFVDELMEKLHSDPVIQSHVVLIHHADDEPLAWLYSNCLFTVFPSLYEGWGLPVSESLAFGRFCVTSSTSSMPEAGCGIAATLDPNDDAAWVALIEDLLDHPEVLRAYEDRIRAEFRPRLWQDAAAELIEQAITTPVAAVPT